MREIRSSGSAEGVMSNHDPYSDSSHTQISPPSQEVKQHFLNFWPLPQGQGSLRPAFGSAMVLSARSCSISNSGDCPFHRSTAILRV